MGQDGVSNQVIERGLPGPPAELPVAVEVPIARWVGPRFAAVLSVSVGDRKGPADERYDSDVQPFRRTADGWEASDGSGGTGWFDPPFRRPSIGPRDVWVLGEHGSGGNGWMACSLFGVAGAEAVDIEVLDPDGSTRAPIESPMGAWVVCAAAGYEAVVRILDVSGAALLETSFSGRLPTL